MAKIVSRPLYEGSLQSQRLNAMLFLDHSGGMLMLPKCVIIFFVCFVFLPICLLYVIECESVCFTGLTCLQIFVAF